MNEIKEWKVYMETAKAKGDLLWKYHQEKRGDVKKRKESFDEFWRGL